MVHLDAFTVLMEQSTSTICSLLQDELINVSPIYTGLYASNGFDGMDEIVMTFVASIC
jgi:hypothetical protein